MKQANKISVFERFRRALYKVVPGIFLRSVARRFLAQGNNEKAVAKLDNNLVVAHSNLGLAFFKLGDFELAVEFASRADVRQSFTPKNEKHT